MALPDTGAARVDPQLTNLSMGARNQSYISDDLFAIVPVKQRSAKLPEYDQSHWFRDAATVRAPATASDGGGFKVNNTASYYCDRYSYHFKYADEDADNVQTPFQLDRDGALFVTDKMQLRREVNFASAHFTTSVWSNDKTGGTDFTKWSDYAGSSPLVDIEAYQDVIEGLIARAGNVMAMGKETWTQLKWHPDLIDTIKHTQKAKMTVEIAAGLMELDNIYIGRTLKTTSAMGTAEASVTYTRVWGKHALLMYRPTAPSLMNPAAGYTLVWQRVPNAIQYIKRFRSEREEATYIEGNSYFVQKLTSANSGVFLSDAVA